MTYLNNLDLNLNQILNAVLQNIASTDSIASAALKEGRLIYDSTSKSIKFYNGNSWVDPAAEPTNVVPVTKGGTGVATLASGEVVVGNGTSGVTTLPIDSTVTESSTNLIKSGAVYTYVTNAITSALSTFESMKFKGTVNATGVITSSDTTISGDTFTTITGYKAGWTFKAAANIPTSVITIGDKPIEAGDMIVAIADCGAEYSATDFAVIQGNTDGVVVGPSSATDGAIAIFDGTTGKIIGVAEDGEGNAITISALLNSLANLFTVNTTDSDVNVATSDDGDIGTGSELTITLKNSGATAGTYGANDALATATKVTPGGTITTAKMTVDAKGRITAIEDQQFTLDTPKRATITNPALTPVSGTCTWTVAHALNVTYPVVQIYEVSSGEMVLADVTYTNANTVTIQIVSETEITAGTYSVTVVG